MKLISIPKDRDEIRRLYSEGYDSASITAHFENCLNATLKEYALIIDLKGHPNIVRSDDVYHTRQKSGTGWDICIKMELLHSLGDFVGAIYDESQVIRLGRDICNALIACEEKQIIHRDIKPANILVAGDGTFKLGDFGVARISEQTFAKTLAGSFDYMSPEVYHGRGYDHRADLYSLGIVLYWMMNGKRGPFLPQSGSVPTAGMVENARERRFTGEALPKPIHGSEELWKIVQKACAFDPKKRYSDAKAMKQALDALVGGIQPPPPPPPPWKMIAVIAGGILAAAGLLFAFGREKDPCAKGHIWLPATCVSAQTCENCGLTNGVPLGHSWQTATCSEPKFCDICGMESGEAAGHDWLPATCERAETCAACGLTQGEPLAHQWSEANCYNPERCQLCGVTVGEPLPHSCEPATFLTPQICTRCGHYIGEPLPYDHIDVEAEVLKIRGIYNDIMSGVESGEIYDRLIRDNVMGYYDSNGNLLRAVVYRGSEGIGEDSDRYSRSYYYDGGKLIFAFYEGADSHRLYFYDELLMRWLYRSGNTSENEDFTFSARYQELERLARNEGLAFADASSGSKAMSKPLASMPSSLKEELNICLSNLAEQCYMEDPQARESQNAEMYELMDFIFNHHYTNYSNVRSRLTEGGEVYMTMTEINQVTERLLGKSLTMDTLLEMNLSVDGEKIYFPIDKARNHNYLAIADLVLELGDGSYEVWFDIFEVGSRYYDAAGRKVITESKLYGYSVENAFQDSELTWCKSGRAVVKKIRAGTVDTFTIGDYQIIYS